jgi:Cu+-exporting ATPase
MTKLSEVYGGTGCGNGHEHQQDVNSGSGTKAGYQCPMKCEGDKMYDAPGNCPVCNMRLTAVNDH